MIKGFQGTTLADFPGKVASIIFLGGCNFRCPYCYNTHLVLPNLLNTLPDISIEQVIGELKRREGFIQGVVITGGEPTIHKDKLVELLFEIRLNLPSLSVKLDTNGSHPAVVYDVITQNLVDFIAVDFKTSRKKYSKLRGMYDKVLRTVKLVSKEFNVDHEIRITLVPSIVDYEDIVMMCEDLVGVAKIALQKFVPTGVELLDETFRFKRYDKEEFNQIVEYVTLFFKGSETKIELRL